jgi:hypothetical protein
MDSLHWQVILLYIPHRLPAIKAIVQTVRLFTGPLLGNLSSKVTVTLHLRAITGRLHEHPVSSCVATTMAASLRLLR